jgi:thioredoxin-related protein
VSFQPKITRKSTSFAISIILGGILIFSGISKLLSVNAFIDLLFHKYQLGVFSLIGPILIIIELIIGINLLFWRNLKKNALILLILLLFFTVSQSYIYINIGVSNCYCFGEWNFLGNDPFIFYIKNTILSIMAAFLFFSNDRVSKKLYFLQIALLLLLTFTLGLHTDIRKTSIIFNDFWYNKQKEIAAKEDNIELQKIVNSLPKEKSYLLFFMTESCNYCLNSIENAKSFKDKNMVDQIVFITITENSEVGPLLSNVFDITSDQYLIKKISQNTFRKISKTYPTAIIIQNNKYLIKHEGYLPSIPVFLAEHPNLKPKI